MIHNVGRALECFMRLPPQEVVTRLKLVRKKLIWRLIMKKFIIAVSCVSVFFIGLGALVEKTGAAFKSDEKALELVRKARLAMGGENALASVKSLRIVGQTTRSITVDGVARAEQGETEIALQFPDKLMKTVKSGSGEGVDKKFEIIVSGDAGESKDKKNFFIRGGEHTDSAGGGDVKRIIIKKDDGTVQELTGVEADKFIASEHPAGDGGHKVVFKKHVDSTGDKSAEHDVEKVFVRRGGEEKSTSTSDGSADSDKKHFVFEHSNGGAEGIHTANNNEMLRLALGLLMTAPEGVDVSYKYVGEGKVDGTACSVVVAETGGAMYKIYFSQLSNLPVMMSYNSQKMPQTFLFRADGAKGGDDDKATKVFTRKIDGPGAEMASFSVKFSDYRTVHGVQLPYKWTQAVGGVTDETFDVTSFEINPANIAEKFQNDKVMVRTKKPGDQ